MRTALYAGLVAGSVFLQAIPAIAGEGSSLRGLKPPRDTLEVGITSATLAGSEPGLKWQAVETLPDLAPRLSRYGAMLEARRFSSSDAGVRTTLYRPVGSSSAALAESSLTPLHDILPKYTLHTQISHPLPGGWGLGFGVRHSEYNFATGNLLSLSAERYWGSFRGAYTLYSNRAEGSDLGSAHRFQVNYFYGERNTVGLAYTTGRDIDHVGLSAGLAASDVRDWTLSGRHWLSPNWALTYDVLTQEQGNLSRRQGLRLGVSRSF